MKSISTACFLGLFAAVYPYLAIAEVAGASLEVVKDDEGRLIVDPPIGQQVTREIGEPLVRTGIRHMKITNVSKVTLKDDAAGKMGLTAMFRAVKAPAGTSGQIQFHQGKYPALCVTPQGVSTTDPAQMAGCFVDTDKDGKFDALAFPGYGVDKSLSAPVAYELEEKSYSVEVENSHSYFVEALYQGVSKGEAKISYREFKGGLARPGFTQDVSYELETDGSGVIAFRGLRIQIVKATRENITYIVQKLGDAPM